MRSARWVWPEVDEDGNMINPHIPQYIKDAPWYYKTDTYVRACLLACFIHL